MAVLQGTKALQAWCVLVTKDYPNVSISNMTSSWASGLGFCALIHHFRPDLIDYASLREEDAFENNALAFATAEQHLGIHALLDAADMLSTQAIDRLSILTYLSQFYQAFGGSTARNSAPPTGNVKTPLIKQGSRLNGSALGGTCRFCQKPVLFLLERLHINGHLAHRTCFKCARCKSQLSLANYYETESEEFCCEICPDEEVTQVQLALTNKLKRESEEKEEEPSNGVEETRLPELEEDQKKDEEPAYPSEEVKEVPPSKKETEDSYEKTFPKVEVAASDEVSSDKHDEVVSISSDKQDDVASISSHKHDEVASISSDKQDVASISSHKQDEVASISSDKQDEVTSSDKQNEITSSDKQDEVTSSDKQDEVTSSDKQDEVLSTSSDKQDEVLSTSSDKQDEVLTTSSDKQDEVLSTSSDKQDEVTPSDKQDEVLTTSSDKQDEGSDKQDEVDDIVPHVDQTDPIVQEEIMGNLPEEEEAPKVIVETADLSEEAVPTEDTKKDEEVESEYPDDLNPFDFDEEPNDDDESLESSKALKEMENQSMSASLNPFGSDFEDEEAADEVTDLVVPPPKPPRSHHYSTTSLNSSLNPFGSDFEDSEEEGGKRSVSPSPSCVSSIRSRKKRRAPLPPGSEKSLKERDNLNRRSQISNLTFDSSSPSGPSLASPLSPDKSDGGIWKKKKGPAPPRPLPPKRQVKKIPRKAVNTELIDIEVKQLEFERQGVALEKTIRELCGSSKAEAEESLGPEAEDLIIQLFELVNEKNELFRRQTELMYMKREHRLEEEHADLEYQIRILMNKEHPSDEQKKEEEALISRLMTVVSQRNEIVDCLEMDRLRELEEDESIEIHMGEFAAVKPPENGSSSDKKKKKKKKKEKKGALGVLGSQDDDKDIDTKEFPPSSLLLSGGSSSAATAAAKASPRKDKAKKLKKKLLSSVSSLTSVKR